MLFRKRRYHPRLECLEDRTLLNYNVSLDAARLLTISEANPGDNSNLTASLTAGTLRFTDFQGLHFNPPTGVNGGDISGGNTNSITVGIGNVTAIAIDLGTGNDFLTLGPFDNPIPSLNVRDGGTTGDMAIVAPGGFTSSGNVSLTGFNSITLNGAVTTANANQLYQGSVFLGSTTTLLARSGNITFTGAIDSNPDSGTFDLNVINTGTTFFGGAIGGAAVVGNLAVVGSSTARFGGNVTTRGAQSITAGTIQTNGAHTTTNSPITGTGNLVLQKNTIFNAGTSNVSLTGTINGAFPLTISAAGTTMVGGAVGNLTPLSNLTVSTGTLNANGPVRVTGNVLIDITTGYTIDNFGIAAATALVRGTSALTLSFNEAGGVGGTTTVTITGRNAGSVTNIGINVPGGLVFSGFANLIGGSSQDVFKFTPQGSIAGNLDAAGGTLDYSAVSGATFVVTGAGPRGSQGTGTGIGGTFTNVNSFIGGPNSGLTLNGNVTNNNDLFLGGNLDSVINGTINGSGRVIFDDRNAGHTLSGTGTINQTLMVRQGTLRPGINGVGRLTVQNLMLTPQATFHVDLNGSKSVLEYSLHPIASSNEAIAQQTAVPGGAHLEVAIGNPLAVSDSFDIITSTTGLSGTFNGLPDGATVIVNGQPLIISYVRGGSTQRVILSPKGSAADLVVGGAGGRVRVMQFDNSVVADFAPFGAAYTGPINVALGDINRDGIKDLIVAAAVGNPDVRVYDGRAFKIGTFNPANPNASLLAQWFPYALQFNVGAYVAVGDVNGDGYLDVVTGASAGNPDVRVYSGQDIALGRFNATGGSLLAQWFAYGLQFNVGATVAVGDIDRDGFGDVITGANVGNPHVKVYSGKAIAQRTFSSGNPDASLLAQFFPYALQFNVGVNVAVGDVNGDGFADIVTGATVGNPDVRIYSGQAIAKRTFDTNHPEASQLDQFFAFDAQTHEGVTVGVVDFEKTGMADIVTGRTRAPLFRIVKGTSTGFLPPALLEGVAPNFQGGIAVGV